MRVGEWVADPSSPTLLAYRLPTDRADAVAVVDERLDICAACGEQFVIPERLMGLHDNRLVVGLRCAACGVRKLAVVRAGTFEDLLVRFDDAYPDVERRLETEEIERFAAALAADAILPEDF